MFTDERAPAAELMMRRRRDEGPAGECDDKRELVEEGKLSSYRITAVSPCLMVMLSVDLWLSTLITGNPVGIKHSSRKKHACS